MQIQKCPAMPAHETLPPEPQFHKSKNHVVTRASFSRDGVVAGSQVSFGDFQSMHVKGGAKLNHGRPRHSERNTFFFNDAQLRLVLLRQLEKRTGSHKPADPTIPPLQRLAAVRVALTRRIPHLEKLLREICGRYVAAKRDGASPDTLRSMEKEIAVLDRCILMARHGEAAILVGVAFYFIRCACDSVDTANRLGITAGAVRQIARRLRNSAAEIGIN
ncbi:MAG: hypothetical protein WBP69_18410 [Terriglobales bacterium]